MSSSNCSPPPPPPQPPAPPCTPSWTPAPTPPAPGTPRSRSTPSRSPASPSMANGITPCGHPARRDDQEVISSRGPRLAFFHAGQRCSARVPTYSEGRAGFSVSPVAEIPAPAGSAAAPNSSPAGGAGTLTCVQPEPSQCIASGDEKAGFRKAPTPPTAQTSPVATAATPQRSLSCDEPPGSGLGTIFQRAPSQCSISVWSSGPPSWFPSRPTAHPSAAATALTEVSQFWSLLFPLSGLGLGTRDQTLPLKRIVNVVSPKGFVLP